MKTNEFKRIAESHGYYIKEYQHELLVKQTNTELTAATVNRHEPRAFHVTNRVSYSLYPALIEYAETPVQDRLPIIMYRMKTGDGYIHELELNQERHGDCYTEKRVTAWTTPNAGLAKTVDKDTLVRVKHFINVEEEEVEL